VEVTPSNYRFTATSSMVLTTPQTLTLQPLGSKRSVTTVSLDSGSGSSTSMTYAKGYVGARWAASDPNGDEMLYKVEIRGLAERDWKLLRDKGRERFLSFDSTTLPDGDYVMRVTATDAPDNPADQALTSMLESDRFVVDNTPPRITGLAGSRSGGKLTLKWQARDERGILSRAEYSLNGGEWTMVDPVSRLSDAPQLDYALTVDSPAGAEATIAVRVTDESDNQAVEKTVIR